METNYIKLNAHQSDQTNNIILARFFTQRKLVFFYIRHKPQDIDPLAGKYHFIP
ncbi:hypothetical protein HanIR_Chr11g0512231 [Helianthus annuus]|nr:hypothetical protein HanIR_Chr11g0512231 [Helianthus annuus]